MAIRSLTGHSLPREQLVASALSLVWVLTLLVVTSAPAEEPVGTTASAELVVDDEAFARAGKQARQEAFDRGAVFHTSDLAAVMNPRAPLGLLAVAPARTALEGEERQLRLSKATLALFVLSEKDHKSGAGARLGTAFRITPEVAVTCFHAFKGLPEPFVVVALDCKGKPVRVSTILALYPREDLAFLKVQGGDPSFLPLRPDVPSGTTVRALGHPLNKYFFTVEGVVARHAYKVGSGFEKVARLNLMIDSIGGFSGSALVDAAGNAVGMLDSFETLKTGEAAYPIQSAIPAATVLARFQGTYSSSMTPEAEAALLRPDSGAGGHEVKKHRVESRSEAFVAVAEVSSDEPENLRVTLTDKAGKEIGQGRATSEFRESLPAGAWPVYDAAVAEARAKTARP